MRSPDASQKTEKNDSSKARAFEEGVDQACEFPLELVEVRAERRLQAVARLGVDAAGLAIERLCRGAVRTSQLGSHHTPRERLDELVAHVGRQLVGSFVMALVEAEPKADELDRAIPQAIDVEDRP